MMILTRISFLLHRIKEGVMSAIPEKSSTEFVDTVYAYITSYLDIHGYAPSHIEILDGCAIDWTTLSNSLARLEELGRIRVRLGKPRALQLVETA
jgi:SOS-response transcriptional repressor LexA